MIDTKICDIKNPGTFGLRIFVRLVGIQRGLDEMVLDYFGGECLNFPRLVTCFSGSYF